MVEWELRGAFDLLCKPFCNLRSLVKLQELLILLLRCVVGVEFERWLGTGVFGSDNRLCRF